MVINKPLIRTAVNVQRGRPAVNHFRRLCSHGLRSLSGGGGSGEAAERSVSGPLTEQRGSSAGTFVSPQDETFLTGQCAAICYTARPQIDARQARHKMDHGLCLPRRSGAHLVLLSRSRTTPLAGSHGLGVPPPLHGVPYASPPSETRYLWEIVKT